MTNPSSHGQQINQPGQGNFADDPFGYVKQDRISPYPSGRSVNALHTKADTDAGPFASHHTLGPGRNQASPGSHMHDGKASKKVGDGLGLVITGSRGGNAALTSLLSALAKVIQFTDSTTP